jgi:hypothetical protein
MEIEVDVHRHLSCHGSAPERGVTTRSSRWRPSSAIEKLKARLAKNLGATSSLGKGTLTISRRSSSPLAQPAARWPTAASSTWTAG